MKKLLIAFVLLLVTVTSFSQRRHHPNRKAVRIKAAMAKYHDNIDNRMKGPNGEAIYIGANGGRYYVKNRKRIYVEYKGNK